MSIKMICLKLLSIGVFVAISRALDLDSSIFGTRSDFLIDKLPRHCKPVYKLPGTNGTSHSNTFELIRQNSDISTVILLEDGSIATGSLGGEINICNANTRTYEATFQAHSDGVFQLIQLPDGRIVSNSLQGNEAKVWNLQTKQRDATLSSPENVTFDIMYLLQDGRIASMSGNKVFIWNIETGVIDFILSGHTDKVIDLTQTENGTIVTCSADKSFKFWNPISGECEKTVTTFENEIRGVYTLNSSLLLTFSEGDSRSMKIWDPERDRIDFTASGTRPIMSVGDRLYVIEGSDAKVCNIATGHCQLAVKDIYCTTCSRFSSLSNTVHIIELKDGRIAFYDNDSITIWDPTDGGEEVIRHDFTLSELIQLKDGRLARGVRGKLVIWSPVGEECDFITENGLKLRYFITPPDIGTALMAH